MSVRDAIVQLFVAAKLPQRAGQPVLVAERHPTVGNASGSSRFAARSSPERRQGPRVAAPYVGRTSRRLARRDSPRSPAVAHPRTRARRASRDRVTVPIVNRSGTFGVWRCEGLGSVSGVDGRGSVHPPSGAGSVLRSPRSIAARSQSVHETEQAYGPRLARSTPGASIPHSQLWTCSRSASRGGGLRLRLARSTIACAIRDSHDRPTTISCRSPVGSMRQR